MKRTTVLKRTRSKYFIHPGSFPSHIVNVLNDHPPGLRSIRLNFHSGVDCLSPGRERVVRRVLASVWKHLGPVKQTIYPPPGSIEFVVLDFPTSEQAQLALNTLNNSSLLRKFLHRAVAEYQKSDDEDMVVRVLEQFFVGESTRPLAGWDDTDVWLLSFKVEA